MMLKGFGKASLLAGTLVFAAAAIAGSTPAPKPVDGRDWYSFGGNDEGDHYSPLDQINANNVSKLGLVWSYDIDTFDAYTAPLEVNGVVYFAAGLSVMHALDARTGKLLWQYDPQVASQEESKTRMRAGWGIRGIAYRDGKVFTGRREAVVSFVETFGLTHKEAEKVVSEVGAAP